MTTPGWKVLLIGGGTGTGKSTLALQLGRLYDVSVIDGDDLRHVAESAVTPGSDPNLHIFRASDFWDLPIDKNVQRTLAWSKRICEIIEPLMARRHFVRRPVIIEAVWLLPEFCPANSVRWNLHGRRGAIHVPLRALERATS
jgi:2-phosphoglycerate kinase